MAWQYLESVLLTSLVKFTPALVLNPSQSMAQHAHTILSSFLVSTTRPRSIVSKHRSSTLCKHPHDDRGFAVISDTASLVTQ